MSMRIVKDYGPQSFIATAYASNTANAYFNFSNYTDIAAHVRLGTVTGTGRVDWSVDHAVEDYLAVSPMNWIQLLAGSGTLATTSAVETIFRASALQQLLPYGRLQIVAKETAGGDLTVADIVAKVLAELK